jgi:transcriptional regulator with XRE-family HTH domain
MEGPITIGIRLKTLRGLKTQEEVAKAVGLSRARYSHYENDRVEPDIETIQKFATYFHVTTDYLLGLSDSPKNESIEIKNIIDDPRTTLMFQDFKDLSDEQKEEALEMIKYIKYKDQQKKNKK